MAPRSAVSWMGAVLPVALMLALSAGASPGGTAVAPATARAVGEGIKVLVPGAAGGTAAVVAAPPDAVSVTGSFAYPADGSIVQAAAVTASSITTRGVGASASGSADVTSLTLFGGEITVASVSARARASAKKWQAVGDVSASSVQELVVLGQPVEPAPGTVVPLGDWGQATVLAESEESTIEAARHGYRTSVLALHVRLTKEHGGLPAGSAILVGYAEAAARGRPAPPDPAAAEGSSGSGDRLRGGLVRPPTPAGREPGRDRLEKPVARRSPPVLTPPLTAGGYVFPVYGPSSWSDTFGAPRAAPVGWHHGTDIFAPLGTPVLAAADGTLFSVGWNDIGGYRLWLRDREGNEFYYAHLSAFSTLAAENAQVKAGDVIGFVGSTGDAEGTPYHLHFEIHPVSTISDGYDGAVNPTKYLLAWQKLKDVPIVGVAGWAAPIASASRLPRPGAILLQVTDISSASGLDPGALRRVLRAPHSLHAGSGAAGLRRPTRSTGG